MKPAYDIKDKLLFYSDYFLRKTLCLWFEVKRPKIKMFLYELIYSLRKFKNYEDMYPSPFDVSVVETVFGEFRVRPGTVDMSNVSPAFERRDVDYLLELTRKLLDEGRKVMFLDVGADLGTYSVTVGNRFRESGRIEIMAFEASASNFQILKENILLNGLYDLVTPQNAALWDQDGVELNFSFNTNAPGSSSLGKDGARGEKVSTAKLDTLLGGEGSGYDALVLKMDVEGAEEKVLEGAGETLGRAKDVYLLVEDFVEEKIIDYLERTGWEFLAKKTPYNSFWRLRP